MTQLQSQFVYRAMRPTGSKTLGVRAAGSQGDLADELRREQLLLLRAWKLPLKGTPPPGLPLKDEAALNEQLAALLDRGVPLVEALEVGASVVQEDSRQRINRLRELVAAGDSFAGACEKVGGFDAVTISVYRAAERTGDLAAAAGRLASSARRRLSIRSKSITVMIYPSVVISIGAGLAFVLLSWVVPMYSSQFQELGGEVPWFSRIIFDFGGWLQGHQALALGVIAALIVGAYFIRSVLRDTVAAVLSLIPAVGRLMLTVELARFFSVMAAMVRSGVPLAEALATSSQVISRANLRAQFEQLQGGLVEGGSWRSLVEQVDELPMSTRKLLIAAERSGDLDEAFDTLSADMAAAVDTQTARVLALLEPLAIIFMFLLIVPLILAVAIPILTVRIGG